MKKVSARAERGKAKRVVSEPSLAGAVDLAALRQQINDLVGKDALQMVAKTIEQVHNGHYQALKYLFEMIGLYPATTTPQEMPQDSLASTLLQCLGVPEGENPACERDDRTQPWSGELMP